MGRSKKKAPKKILVDGCVVRPKNGSAYVRVPIAGAGRTRPVYGLGAFYLDDGITVNPAALQRAAEEVRTARAQGGPAPARKGALTMRDGSERYKAHRVAELPGSSRHEHDRITFDRLCSLYGDVPVAEFGPLMLLAFRQDLEAQRRADGLSKLCTRSIGERLGRVKAMFEFLVSRQLVDPNVLVALRTVKGPRRGSGLRGSKRVLPVDEKVLTTTLPHLGRIPRTAVELCALSGARMGEILILRPMDVDTSVQPWRYVPTSHKNQWRNLERTIFFGPRSQRLLAPFLADRMPSAFAFSPREAELERLRERTARRVVPAGVGHVANDEARALRLEGLGDHYTTEVIRRALERACLRAKVGVFTPHMLRHLAATTARASHGFEVAGSLLGDSDTAVISRYSASRNEELARKYAQECG